MWNGLKNLNMGIVCFIFFAAHIIVFVAQEYSFKRRMTEETEGIITDAPRGGRGRAYITHSVNGKQYTSRLSNSFSRIFGREREGERIRIFYDPNDPARIRSDNNIFSLFLPFVFSSASLGLSLFWAKIEADSKNMGKMLRESTRALYSKHPRREPLPSSFEHQSLFSDDEPDLKKIEAELIANCNELDENDRDEYGRYENSEESFFRYEVLLYVAIGVISFGYRILVSDLW